MRLSHRVRGLALGVGLAALAAAPAPADELTEMGLEDLMGLEVTSVSKRSERLSETPAAVYVITNEDIRRSGATSIPEALRLAPGVQVARISSDKWAISARGFNSEFANKLLVLIDGRSVYTPLFSGVWWDVQDVLLEDVDRIEVIRGPGATLWGANAVNGVINIITRSAEETHGGYLTAGGGTEENRFGALRWGGRFGDEGHYRVYAKHFDRDAFEQRSGDEGEDDWDMGRGGFRMDWGLGENDELTLQGDYYRGEVGERHTRVDSIVPAVTTMPGEDVRVDGWNLLGRWSHGFEGGSEATLQAYVDRTRREIELLDETRYTADLDFHHRFSPAERHSLIWGLGYRVTDDRLDGSDTIFFDDAERTDHHFTGFVQEEWELVADRLTLSMGTKLGHNDYTGFEYQPGGRLLWTPHEDHTAWAAVSRAVRTPSRADHDVRIRTVSSMTFSGTPGGVPVSFPFTSEVLTAGDDDFESEELMAYEMGYRFLPSPALSVDVAAFFNVYDELTTFVQGPTDGSALVAFLPTAVGATLGGMPIPPMSGPGATTVARFDNEGEARTYGAEIAAHWDVRDWWRLSGTYSLLEMNVDGVTQSDPEGESPTHQASLRSYMDLPAGFELDTLLWWVENLPAQDVSSYARVDVRLGWRPRDDLRLSLVGQNLNEGQHAEYKDTLFWATTEVPRGFYGTVEWGF